MQRLFNLALIRWLLVGLVGLAPSPLFAITAAWHPPIDSDGEKLTFLLTLRKKLPTLFRDSMRTRVDLFRLIRHQKEVLQTLSRDPLYLNSLEAQQMIQMDLVPPPGGIPVGQIQLNPKAVEAWKRELLAELEELRGDTVNGIFLVDFAEKLRLLADGLTEDSVDAASKVVEQTKRLGSIPRGMLSGELEALKLQQAAINSILLNHRKLGPSRDFSRLDAMVAEWERIKDLSRLNGLSREALQTARNVFAKKEVFRKMVGLAVFADLSARWDLSASWSEMSTRLKAVDENALIQFHDRDDFLAPRVMEVLRFAGISALDAGPSYQKLHRTVTDDLYDRVHHFVSQTQTLEGLATVPVRLVQVPPVLGVFRGFVGSDCSSRVSFPYPNDPDELVFFVLNPSLPSELKGYVSATRVNKGGETALYLHTISGSHISSGDVELILRGLDQSKSALGVSVILLPPREKLPALLNYPAISGVFKSHAQGQKRVQFAYFKPQLRRVLEDFSPREGYNSGQYDHQTQTPEGLALTFRNQLLTEIRTNVSPATSIFFESAADPESEKENLFEFLMEMSQRQMGEVFTQVIRIQEVSGLLDPSAFAEWMTLLQRGPDLARSESVGDFIRRMKKEVSERFNISGEFLTRYSYFLYPSVIECSDAFSASEIEQTAEWIIEDFRRNKFTNDETPWHLIHRFLFDGRLGHTRAFQRFFHQLADGLEHGRYADTVLAANAAGALIYVSREVHLALASALMRSDFSPVHLNEVRRAILLALNKISPECHEVSEALVTNLATEKNHQIIRILGQVLLKVDPVRWAEIFGLPRSAS